MLCDDDNPEKQAEAHRHPQPTRNDRTAAESHGVVCRRRIGLFIHWGPYALLGGVWNDQDVPGAAEHIRSHAKIPHAQYAQQALTFNPVAFDQDA